MRILVAIESSENANTLAKTTLRWAPRAGYNMRIFIPDTGQLSDYQEAIAKANYDEYLDMHDGMIIIGQDPRQYAKQNGFDLLLLLPDNLASWGRKRNLDKMIIEYAKDVGSARVKLTDANPGQSILFNNGTVIKKL